jgi:hypothetical protein
MTDMRAAIWPSSITIIQPAYLALPLAVSSPMGMEKPE